VEAAVAEARDAPVGGSRHRVVAALMLALALGALDQTVVATSLPSVVRELGGYSLYTWVFSGYVLAQAVTIPIYGRLADTIGRKPVLLFGMAVFLVGSACCGAAWSMPALIAFRVLQGLGAGAIQPTVMTLAGDLFSLEERARVQGYLSSVFGISSLVGPVVGGLITGYASWRWVFFVNLPVGFAAIAVIGREVHEARMEKRAHRIDYGGAALLAAGLGLLVFVLLRAGSSWGWESARSLLTLAASLVILALFWRREQVVSEPILPTRIFHNPGITASCRAALMVGALAVGVAAFVPTFLQVVVGASPITAGLTFAAMSIGWPLASSQSGRLYLRIGFRDTALIGTSGCILAAVLLLILPSDRSPAVFVPATFLMGLGIGLTSAPMLIGAQSLVGHGARGAVTGAVMFCRSLGTMLGAAVYGSIAVATVGRVVEPGATPPPQALDSATRHVFAALVVVACLGLVSLLFAPRRATPLD
jgi:EmrB/QacA subfamily drug resistance transporter